MAGEIRRTGAKAGLPLGPAPDATANILRACLSVARVMDGLQAGIWVRYRGGTAGTWLPSATMRIRGATGLSGPLQVLFGFSEALSLAKSLSFRRYFSKAMRLGQHS
jgi:hypothetical protein